VLYGTVASILQSECTNRLKGGKMKTAKSYFRVIAFVLVSALIILAGGSFYQSVLANIRYATMNEKKASKDVLVQTENETYKFDISEYGELRKIIENILKPCFDDLLTDLKLLNEAYEDNKDTNLAESIQSFYYTVEKWQAVISLDINNYKGQIKLLLEDINNNFLNIKNETTRILNKQSDIEIQIANRKIFVSRIKDFFFNFCYNFLYLITDLQDNKNMISLYNHVIETVNNFDNDPLIDLDTPYFTLPPEYAENKEKMIFSYIERGKRDARSVMALILLYIKMKNITDAELLYHYIISPYHLSNKQDNELSQTISLMINELRYNNPTAILDKSIIDVDNNLNVIINERYFINCPENDKDVFVFLPYHNNDIALFSLLDNNNKTINIKNTTTFWKDSCYIQFPCDENLVEFNLKYKVNNFFNYSEKHGTYTYKYGGINQNVNYTCVLNMSSSLKSTLFLQYPTVITQNKSDNEQIFEWFNPTIPYKISSLNFTYNKNGIAGEIIYSRFLYNKWLYLIAVFSLFLLSYVIISNKINNLFIYQCVFVVISAITLFFLFFDIQFVGIMQIITKKMPDIIFRIILFSLVMIISFSFYFIKFERGNKYFRIISSIILISICAYGVNLYIQNTDATKIAFKIFIGIYGCYLFYVLIKHLSKQMEVSETLMTIMSVSIIFISISLFNLFKVSYISKTTLNIIGIILCSIFSLIIGLCLVSENAQLRSAKEKTKMELFIDFLIVNYQGKAYPIANLLLLSFVAISFISDFAFLALLLQLIITLFGSKIKSVVNNGNIFKIKLPKKKKKCTNEVS
jgi:hypothetical protein